jgi:hypothetical protein
MQFYIHRNGERSGPFSPLEVRSSLAAGAIQPTDLAWHEGASEWLPLGSIPSFTADQPPATPNTVVRAPELPSISGLAVASMIMGIASFLTCGLTAIPAVIMGHIALHDIKKEPARFTGREIALAGVISGYLGIIFAILLVIAVLIGIVVIGLHSPR